jgi:hypothetical protein
MDDPIELGHDGVVKGTLHILPSGDGTGKINPILNPL